MPHAQYTVIEATQNDHAFIVNAQIKMAYETEKMKLDDETVKKGVEAVLKDPNKGKYFVAKKSGAEINSEANSSRMPSLETIACLLTIPEWSDWRNGTVLWIHSVYVTEEAREKGFYKIMYEFLKEKVKHDPTLRGLRLYVDKTNLNAQKVYRKCGMNNEHYELYEWMKS